MKTKNVLKSVLVAGIVLSSTWAFADEWEGTNAGIKSQKSVQIESYKADKAEMKEMRTQEMTEHKKQMQEHRDQTVEKREIMKQNRTALREEIRPQLKEGFQTLSQEQKAKLEELRISHQAEITSLKEELKTAGRDEEKRAELRLKYEVLLQKHVTELKEIIGSDSDFSTKISQAADARKEVRLQNQQIRSEIRAERKDLLEKKQASIVKYRTVFTKQLSLRLEKIPVEKLEKISEKIDALYTKTEANTRITDAKKEALLAQLVALQDVIETRLEETEIDMDSLLED